MMKEDNKKAQNENTKPLFTGDYRRDTAVSEYEKVTEASIAVYNAIKNVLKKHNAE